MRFVTAVVVGLPRPDLEGESPCMPAGTPWWRRLTRQVVPRQRGRACCWYHGGDWRRASRIAIRLFAHAHRSQPNPAEACRDALQLARAEGIAGWTLQAVKSLLLDPIQPEREIGYVNGRHRAQAMLDAGVRRTLVARWVMPDPARDSTPNARQVKAQQ
jgi:hypothetical protein